MLKDYKITDDMATTAQDPNGLVLTVVQPVKALLESTGAMKAIEEGINTFMEDIPWLMKGLDEIARIHPVVTGTFGNPLVLKKSFKI